MKLPNLGSLCCMPRPKMMSISWTLRGRLQYIPARGLLKKIQKKKKEESSFAKKKSFKEKNLL